MNPRIRTSDHIRKSANVRTGRTVTRSTGSSDAPRESIDNAIADVVMNAKRAEQAIREAAE